MSDAAPQQASTPGRARGLYNKAMALCSIPSLVSAINRQRGVANDVDKAKFVPRFYRDADAFYTVMLQKGGIYDLVNSSFDVDSDKKMMKFWGDFLLIAFMKTTLDAKAREERGKSATGARHDDLLVEFFTIFEVYGGAKMANLVKENLGGPSTRLLRRNRQQQDMVLFDGHNPENYKRISDCLKNIGYTGPLAAGTDQTVCLKRLRYSNGFLVGAEGGDVPVGNEDELETTARQLLKKGLTFVAGIHPSPKRESAMDIANQISTFLERCHEHGLNVVSMGSDGAANEFSAQKESEVAAKFYSDYRFDIPSASFSVRIPRFGSCSYYTTPGENSYVGHDKSPLYITDIFNTDKQDDGRAYRVFNSATLLDGNQWYKLLAISKARLIASEVDEDIKAVANDIIQRLFSSSAKRQATESIAQSKISEIPSASVQKAKSSKAYVETNSEVDSSTDEKTKRIPFSSFPYIPNGIQTYEYVHLSPIDDITIHEFNVFASQPHVEEDSERKLFDIICLDFGAQIFLQRSHLLRTILNGLDSSSKSRFLRSLEYVEDLIIEWEKVFRRASDAPLSLSSSTPVNITPNVSMTAANTRAEHNQNSPSDYSMSLPFACHEIFFRMTNLLQNPNIVYKAIRIIYRLLPFLTLHIDVIVDHIHPDPSSYIIDEMCMDYIRMLVPAIEALSSLQLSEPMESWQSEESIYQRERVLALVCDCATHFSSTAKRPWYILSCTLNAILDLPSNNYFARTLLRHMFEAGSIPIVSSLLQHRKDWARHSALKQLHRMLPAQETLLTSEVLFQIVQIAFNDSSQHIKDTGKSLLKKCASSLTAANLVIPLLTWLQVYCDEAGFNMIETILDKFKAHLDVRDLKSLTVSFGRDWSELTFSINHSKADVEAWIDQLQQNETPLVDMKSLLQNTMTYIKEKAFRQKLWEKGVFQWIVTSLLHKPETSLDESVVDYALYVAYILFEEHHSDIIQSIDISVAIDLVSQALLAGFSEWSLQAMDGDHSLVLPEMIAKKYHVYPTYGVLKEDPTSDEFYSAMNLGPLEAVFQNYQGMIEPDNGSKNPLDSFIQTEVTSLTSAKSHTEFSDALDRLSNVCVTRVELISISNSEELIQTFEKVLMITPTSIDDKVLLQQILQFLSDLISISEKPLGKLHEIILRSISSVLLPLMAAETSSADTASPSHHRSDSGGQHCTLHSHIVAFLKQFLRHCSLSEIANILLKTSCLEVLIDSTYLVFSSETSCVKGHSDRIDCLELLVQLASIPDLASLVRSEVVINFIRLVVQVLGFSQHNYVDSTDGNSFTYKDRSVYRLVGLCLRNLSRAILLLSHSSRAWVWGSHWLFEDDINWLPALLNDDEKQMQKHGLGILGNLILIKESYQHLCPKIPQFLDMAFSYALDLERSEPLRKEAIVIINNFLITFAHDNKFSTVPLIPGGDDIQQDVEMVPADLDSMPSQGALPQLLSIFDQCGFFERLRELLDADKTMISYICSLSELFLNLSLITPDFLHKKLSDIDGWFTILEFIADSVNLTSIKFSDVETRMQVKFRHNQQHSCYALYARKIQCNILTTIRCCVHGNESTQRYFLESTSLLIQLKNIVNSADLSKLQTSKDDMKVMSSALILLSELVRECARSSYVDLYEYLSTDNLGRNLMYVINILLMESTELWCKKAGCLLLGRLLSLHYGELLKLDLEPTLNSKSNLGVLDSLGTELAASLIHMAINQLDTTDAVFMESLRLSLQCLLGRCHYAKMYAIRSQFAAKLTKIITKQLSGSPSNTQQIVLHFMFSLLRHYFAGSIEAKGNVMTDIYTFMSQYYKNKDYAQCEQTLQFIRNITLTLDGQVQLLKTDGFFGLLTDILQCKSGFVRYNVLLVFINLAANKENKAFFLSDANFLPYITTLITQAKSINIILPATLLIWALLHGSEKMKVAMKRHGLGEHLTKVLEKLSGEDTHFLLISDVFESNYFKDPRAWVDWPADDNASKVQETHYNIENISNLLK
ncbi:hypothetical protein HDV05_008398 [Chytridiales sp. JEL 0842]|nr:hypothetical protein HDV05_008398 [Chytridiales sp. JEL 0842]